MTERLPNQLRPVGIKESLEEYPVKIERMEGVLERRSEECIELNDLTDEQLLDFAHFAIEPESPDGLWVDHRPGHNRSLVFSNEDVHDRHGNNLGKINIKGTGFVSLGGVGPIMEAFKGRHILPERHRRTLSPKKIELGGYYRDTVFGLMSVEDAYLDYDNGEKLSALGIRTSRGLAIIKLDTIFYPGKGIIKVAELKQEGLLPEDFDPAVYVRATGSDHRVRDYEDPEFFARSNKKWLKERKAKAFGLAIERVEAELGAENFTILEYVRWFAKTLGEQVGILHKNGYAHGGLYKRPTGYVHPVDITLDCRILDHDSIRTIGSLRHKGINTEDAEIMLSIYVRNDLTSAKNSLEALLTSCRDVSSTVDKGDLPQASRKEDLLNEELFLQFDKSYIDAMQGDLKES